MIIILRVALLLCCKYMSTNVLMPTLYMYSTQIPANICTRPVYMANIITHVAVAVASLLGAAQFLAELDLILQRTECRRRRRHLAADAASESCVKLVTVLAVPQRRAVALVVGCGRTITCYKIWFHLQQVRKCRDTTFNCAIVTQLSCCCISTSIGNELNHHKVPWLLMQMPWL